MPGQRGRCGAQRVDVQDSLALHKVVGQSMGHAQSRIAGRGRGRASRP